MFIDVIAKDGAKLTPNHRDAKFSTFKRLMILTCEGTKQVFGAYADCVVVPPLFVDYLDDMSQVPMLQFLPPKAPDKPAV